MSTRKATRKKATTPLGRSILQKERQRLAKEQAVLGERFMAESRDRLTRKERTEAKPEEIAFNRGMVRRVSAVLASEEVNVPIETRPQDGRFSAWTDFTQIHVDYTLHDDARLTAAVLRGMLYHEGGHIRFTIPWPNLITLATEQWKALHGPASNLPEYPDRTALKNGWNMLEDQRMETAVTSDSPRKAVYFTPMMMAEFLTSPTTAKDNWPLLVWRRYLPKHLRDKARTLWVLQHGEAKAIEVEKVVTTYVTAEDPLEMYLAAIRMADLMKQHPLAFDGDFGHDHRSYRNEPQPEDQRDKLQIPIDPSMLDEETMETLEEMMKALAAQDNEDEEPEASNDEADDENDDSPWYDKDEEPEVEYVLPLPAPSEQGGTPEPSDANDGEDGDGGEATESDDLGGDEKSRSAGGLDEGVDSDESADAPKGGMTGSHGEDEPEPQPLDSKSFQEDFARDLEKATEEADAERYEDKALDGDMSAYEAAKGDHDSNLMPYNAGTETDGALIAVAENLAAEIEQAFQANTMDKAPAWVEEQRRGIVNVLRYETRQPGDTEFYRAWVDDDQPGFDIAVSVLLDYSGSMGDSVQELAQAGYASKLACQRLGIPCTVVLWDTRAQTLWDAEEDAETMPVINSAGGTNPVIALDDLDNHRLGRSKHIVLIFTDGQWGSDWGTASLSLAPYKREGQYMIGFGMGCPATTLARYGCDESYEIKDMLEIPKRLEMTLIDHS